MWGDKLKIPVIILTTLADNKLTLLAKQNGIDYLLKDEYDESILFTTAKKAIDRFTIKLID